MQGPRAGHSSRARSLLPGAVERKFETICIDHSASRRLQQLFPRKNCAACQPISLSFFLFLQFCVCNRVSGRIRGRPCGFEVSSSSSSELEREVRTTCHPMAKATQVRQVRISGQVSCSSLVLSAWCLVLGAIGACTRTRWWLARCRRRRRRHQSTVDGPERESLDSSRGGQRHQP